LLVPSRTPEPLAQAIITLIANAPMRHQMGQAGYHRCVEQFSIEATVQKTETLYRELLEPAV
jgi:glycosyltransferase involved in cell wall biosynthesis